VFISEAIRMYCSWSLPRDRAPDMMPQSRVVPICLRARIYNDRSRRDSSRLSLSAGSIRVQFGFNSPDGARTWDKRREWRCSKALNVQRVSKRFKEAQKDLLLLKSAEGLVVVRIFFVRRPPRRRLSTTAFCVDWFFGTAYSLT